MRLPDEPDIPPQINIVPMIDVIFAILTFFIMSSLYLSRSEGLPVNLPKAATVESQVQNPLTVTVDSQGQISLNRQTVQLENLKARVQGLLGKNQQALVVISADERVSHGRVIAVMDKLRAIPGVKLAIAAQHP